MTTPGDQLVFKNRLKEFCETIINGRIAAARGAMEDAQDAANGEEKSSAGDKYETSRAMNHLEKDMHAGQLMNHLRQLSALRAIKVDKFYTLPVAGALVTCEQFSIFIGAGLGRQIIDGNVVIFVSPESPIARKMTGKRVGDKIDLNGQVRIVDIY